MSHEAGRVALVTGAGQGVGRQTALDLLGQGIATRLVINDFDSGRAEAVAAEVRAAGGEAVAAPFDVSDHAAVREAVERAVGVVGPVDILVNNAGNSGTAGYSQDPVPFWDSDVSQWSPWIGVNLVGVMNCTHAVLKGMVDRGYGRVVTVVSDAGRVGEPNLVVYSGAKAGAAGFMRAVGRAAGRHGVTANCVSLGATRTPATTVIDEFDDQQTRRALSSYAVKRFGEPADASAAICFLASDSASWITTQTLPVNGGYSSAL